MYIDIKYFKENIKWHEVFIKYISIELMIADPITKSLPVNKVYSHVKYMKLINSFVLSFSLIGLWT
jgi:hypothetical protein